LSFAVVNVLFVELKGLLSGERAADFGIFCSNLSLRQNAKDLSRRNTQQELIAKRRKMTGFDEWMCMPAIWHMPCSIDVRPLHGADDTKRGVDHARRHHACAQEG
jgi:hypothetical protein